MKKTKLLIVTLIAFVAMIAMFTTDAQAQMDIPDDFTVIFSDGSYGRLTDSNEIQIQVGYKVEQIYSSSTQIEYVIVSNHDKIEKSNDNKSFTAKSAGTEVIKIIPQGVDPETYTEYMLINVNIYDDIKATWYDQGLLEQINTGFIGPFIKSDYLRVAKENNVPIVYEQASKLLKFKIMPEDITNTSMDLDISEPDYYEHTKLNFTLPYHISLLHDNFPAKVKITMAINFFEINNDGIVYNDQTLKMFAYDESTDTFEYIGNAEYKTNPEYKTDGDHGFVTFEIAKGGNYAFIKDFDLINNIPLGAKYTGHELFNMYYNNILPGQEEPIAPTDTVIEVSNDDKTVVDENVFETAKNNKTNVTIKVGDTISWSFDGEEIQNSEIKFKPSVKISNEKFNTIESNEIKEGVYIDFLHSGKLPGLAFVKLNVGKDKYGEKATTLHLYYYNPTIKRYEYVQPVKYENGVAQFSIDHCSTYVLVEKKLDITPGGTQINGTVPVASGTSGAPTVGAAPAPAVATGILDNEPKAGEVTLLPVAILAIVSLGVCVVTKK